MKLHLKNKELHDKTAPYTAIKLTYCQKKGAWIKALLKIVLKDDY